MKAETTKTSMRRNTVRIGQRKVKSREATIEPGYYYSPRRRTLEGYLLRMLIQPFNGETFLRWSWRNQDDSLWIDFSSDNHQLAAAAVERGGMKKMTIEKEEKATISLAFFYSRCEDHKYSAMLRHVVSAVAKIPCLITAEGKWISEFGEIDGNVVTVLETTRVHIRFICEEYRLLLPPGTVKMISPSVNKLKDNMVFKILDEGKEELRRLSSIFSLSQTPAELAHKLRLKPARIKNSLVIEEENA